MASRMSSFTAPANFDWHIRGKWTIVACVARQWPESVETLARSVAERRFIPARGRLRTPLPRHRYLFHQRPRPGVGGGPKAWADFWDVKKFLGNRSSSMPCSIAPPRCSAPTSRRALDAQLAAQYDALLDVAPDRTWARPPTPEESPEHERT